MALSHTSRRWAFFPCRLLPALALLFTMVDHLPAQSTDTLSESTPDAWLSPRLPWERPDAPQTFSLCLFLGTDLEKTPRRYMNDMPAMAYLNSGVAFRYRPRYGRLQWGLELWSGSIATPRVEVETVEMREQQGVPTTRRDTVALLRLRGPVVAATLMWDLETEASLLVGLQVGHYGKAMTEHSESEVDLLGSFGHFSRGYSSAYKPAPDWVRRFQPGLRIGLEKWFFGRFRAGLSVQQAFLDLSKGGEGRNVTTSWLAYVGYRFGLPAFDLD